MPAGGLDPPAGFFNRKDPARMTRGTPEFYDDLQADNIEPLSQAHYDFDWEGLYARLGEAQSESGADWTTFSACLLKLLKWCVRADKGTGDPVQRAGRRVIAMAWVIRPNLFDGTPSCRKLSAALGKSRDFISAPAAEFTRKFGVRSPAQQHGMNGGHVQRLVGAHKQPDHANTPTEASEA